ncbi:hypothetical protein C1H76_3211 [Elsinoe australis]|uniref:Uncharacterized protein n=1 Tax=Elsinoe australis TaxID=40998 RepID=A0A4V6DXD3_9PEZI|nr:hypothetical protein C1H76_3211 [Elsinoe australis]
MNPPLLLYINVLGLDIEALLHYVALGGFMFLRKTIDGAVFRA